MPSVWLAAGGLALVLVLWQVSPWLGGAIALAVALGLLAKAQSQGMIG